MKYYAGIGSRETPPEVLTLMTNIAMRLHTNGWTLRSGGAVGADTAFEKGTTRKEIFGARDCSPAAMEISSMYHPNLAACAEYVRLLHGRNAMIMLGTYVKGNPLPVSTVICWTPEGKVTGGTGQALRMAEGLGIPVCNLGDPLVFERAQDLSIFDDM